MLAAVVGIGYLMLRSSGASAATVEPGAAAPAATAGGSMFGAIGNALTGLLSSNSGASSGGSSGLGSALFDEPAPTVTNAGPLPVAVSTVQDAPRVASAMELDGYSSDMNKATKQINSD